MVFRGHNCTWFVVAIILYIVMILLANKALHKPQSALQLWYSHADMCSEDRLSKIVQIRQNVLSSCPNRTLWWLHFAEIMSEGRRQPLIHVNIGCNKGVDFLATLHDLSGDDKFSPMTYLERLDKAGIVFPNEGACGQLKTTANRARPVLESRRKVIGHCIEPAPTTFEALKQGMKDLEGQGQVFLGQYIMGSQPGEAFFPHVEVGAESLGLSKVSGVPVPVTTLDKYAQIMGIDYIDVLSIDTEGHDIHVLYGGLNLLVSGVVRILEFEVHTVGHWGVSRVDNVVTMLDNMGFTCYWHLNGEYPLLRATGCMAEELESDKIKVWSNMVCVNRREHHVEAMFESLSKQMESVYSLEKQ